MSKKISVDLTDENFETLDHWKEDHKMPYSTVMNLLLRILCRSSDVKEELITICKSRIRSLYSQMDQAGDFEYQELFNKASWYLDILSFITNDPQLSVTSILSETQMKKIRLADGTLIYPENCILLNGDSARLYRHVSIVEVRNASFSVPHFIYFSDKEANRYTDTDTAYIEQLCAEKWPRFQEIINTAKHPIYDPANPLVCLNDLEMHSSPQIGHFGIRANNDPSFSNLYAAPMGIIIVRDQNSEGFNDSL